MSLILPKHLYGVTSGSLQKVSPLLQCTDNSEHLFVMDLIVLFHRRQEFAVEGHQVSFSLSGQLLREDGSRGKVGAVSLDAEELQALR